MLDSTRRMPSNDMRSKHQTFRIEDELYTLINRRGTGNFATVWSSITSQGYRTAVKVFDLRNRRNNLNPAKIRACFANEIKMLYIIRHAENCAVTIYGSAIDLRRGLAFIAMELGNDTLLDRVENLHGTHLKRARSGSDYISTKDRIHIWIQLVNIIIGLRQYNIIHRDIKPANLIFFGSQLKVVDFGIAQIRSAGQYESPVRNHSGYSAPECLTAEAPVTSKVDIYSIGAILYYLTYGKAPMRPSSRAPFGVRRTRSTRVQNLLYHCLQRNLFKRPSHRWLAEHPLTTALEQSE
ncbi:unnamed protein product [Adineta steineri]|uniref:Protein kinase domain-containing protein n=1 Tax=Adineta steineri TaxID=433720 RepID=A0A815S7W2_9BILA|nr:unnamed protein product [Adineta steineri]CAF1163187.1 unnamed protein product [Adineta steineri]CAF1488295.1 unnamed protein product [Adineta steineri]CAF1640715.1 unnamed protein product [Adineta steineri]